MSKKDPMQELMDLIAFLQSNSYLLEPEMPPAMKEIADANDGEAKGKVFVTPGTKETFDKLGIPLPDWVTVREVSEEEKSKVMYVCRKLMEGEKPGLSDNLTGNCAYCDHKIQFRPYAPQGVLKVCDSCALERARAGEPH